MNLEDRLSRLEKSNRRLRLCCAGLALALAGVFVVAAESDKAGVQEGGSR